MLLLSPTQGELPFPKVDHAIPLAMHFERDAIVARLDKRLSAAVWTAEPHRELPASFLRASRTNLCCALRQSEGWPYIEIAYPEHTKVLLCGYPIIQTWNKGPARPLLVCAIWNRWNDPRKPSRIESKLRPKRTNTLELP